MPFFAVAFRDAQVHLVFANSEFSAFPDGQQSGVLIVLGPDAIGHALVFQCVFLADHLLRLGMLVVRAEEHARNGHGPALVPAAIDPVHFR